MKKYLIVLGILFVFSIAYPYDGSAGPSLNRGDTIEEYNRLMEISSDAIENKDREMKEEAIDGIEDFLYLVEEYRIVSSPGASKYLNRFEGDLGRRLEKLKEIK